jgi:hypothetical protein
MGMYSPQLATQVAEARRLLEPRSSKSALGNIDFVSRKKIMMIDHDL